MVLGDRDSRGIGVRTVRGKPDRPGTPPAEGEPMRRLIHSLPALVLVAGLFVPAPGVRAADGDAAGGRLNNLKVLSDRVDDVTTVENILRSFLRPGMSE